LEELAADRPKLTIRVLSTKGRHALLLTHVYNSYRTPDLNFHSFTIQWSAVDMAGLNRFGFLATAIVFHLVYILSIFDIYFVSPIVSGMRLVGVERPDHVKPPADRLVLFVGTVKRIISHSTGKRPANLLCCR
jgi:phosphatidylinositol glycan class N